MLNTEWLYNAAKKFQDARDERTKQYDADMKALEKYKGSDGYQKDVDALKKQYTADVAVYQKECRDSANSAFKYMSDSIKDRPTVAPTAEQLRLIELLKMKALPDTNNRTSVKAYGDACEQVAKSVKDCPMALDIVNETARAAGVMRTFTNPDGEISAENAQDELDSLRKSFDDFVSYDTTFASRTAAEFANRMYGTPMQTVRRKLFTDEASFYKDMGFNDKQFKQFSRIVDGQEGRQDGD